MTEILSHLDDADKDGKKDGKISNAEFKNVTQAERAETVRKLDALKHEESRQVIEATHQAILESYKDNIDAIKNEFLSIATQIKNTPREKAKLSGGMTNEQRDTIHRMYVTMRIKSKNEALKTGKKDFFDGKEDANLEKGYYDTLRQIVNNNKWGAFVDRLVPKPAEVDPNKKKEEPEDNKEQKKDDGAPEVKAATSVEVAPGATEANVATVKNLPAGSNVDIEPAISGYIAEIKDGKIMIKTTQGVMFDAGDKPSFAYKIKKSDGTEIGSYTTQVIVKENPKKDPETPIENLDMPKLNNTTINAKDIATTLGNVGKVEPQTGKVTVTIGAQPYTFIKQQSGEFLLDASAGSTLVGKPDAPIKNEGFEGTLKIDQNGNIIYTQTGEMPATAATVDTKVINGMNSADAKLTLSQKKDNPANTTEVIDSDEKFANFMKNVGFNLPSNLHGAKVVGGEAGNELMRGSYDPSKPNEIPLYRVNKSKGISEQVGVINITRDASTNKISVTNPVEVSVYAGSTEKAKLNVGLNKNLISVSKIDGLEAINTEVQADKKAIVDMTKNEKTSIDGNIYSQLFDQVQQNNVSPQGPDFYKQYRIPLFEGKSLTMKKEEGKFVFVQDNANDFYISADQDKFTKSDKLTGQNILVKKSNASNTTDLYMISINDDGSMTFGSKFEGNTDQIEEGKDYLLKGGESFGGAVKKVTEKNQLEIWRTVDKGNNIQARESIQTIDVGDLTNPEMKTFENKFDLFDESIIGKETMDYRKGKGLDSTKIDTLKKNFKADAENNAFENIVRVDGQYYKAVLDPETKNLILNPSDEVKQKSEFVNKLIKSYLETAMFVDKHQLKDEYGDPLKVLPTPTMDTMKIDDLLSKKPGDKDLLIESGKPIILADRMKDRSKFKKTMKYANTDYPVDFDHNGIATFEGSLAGGKLKPSAQVEYDVAQQFDVANNRRVNGVIKLINTKRMTDLSKNLSEGIAAKGVDLSKEAKFADKGLIEKGDAIFKEIAKAVVQDKPLSEEALKAKGIKMTEIDAGRNSFMNKITKRGAKSEGNLKGEFVSRMLKYYADLVPSTALDASGKLSIQSLDKAFKDLKAKLKTKLPEQVSDIYEQQLDLSRYQEAIKGFETAPRISSSKIEGLQKINYDLYTHLIDNVKSTKDIRKKIEGIIDTQELLRDLAGYLKEYSNKQTTPYDMDISSLSTFKDKLLQIKEQIGGREKSQVGLNEFVAMMCPSCVVAGSENGMSGLNNLIKNIEDLLDAKKLTDEDIKKRNPETGDTDGQNNNTPVEETIPAKDGESIKKE